ncbi:MAG: Trm112 family protein [Candidatus Omnitrophica bacterium]|nr:Trm112 family protein [Candidatus Omnitrophota bacterium]
MSKELLEILACPVCKQSVELKQDKLICQQCKLAFPIKDDIPVMLKEQALPI